ncbi:hypothetical protein Tco_1433543, partial [Tanacetum coccineum]
MIPNQGVFWGADEEISDGGSPRVIIYEYDGLPMQPVAPLSPDYVLGPEHPTSPDYVPGPEHLPSPVEIPYIPEPEYPEYLAMWQTLTRMRIQTRTPRRIMLPADGGDGNDEPSDDDDDIDNEEEEPSEDEDDDEEEEHLAPVDSSAALVVDLVPSAGDTKAFETDESAPTPRSPQIRVPFAQTRLRRARKTIRLEPPMSASMEARIAEYAATPTPPLPVASSQLPLPSPLTTSPTNAGAPLGYRVAGIRMRVAAASPPLLLPSTSHRTDVPEAKMPPQKRACFTTPAPGLEIGESSAAALALDRETVYACIAWTGSEERSAAIEAHVRTLEAQVATFISQTTSLQTQLTTALGRIETLEARDPEPQDGPAEAKMPPKRRTTRATPATITTPTTTVTDAQLQALIDRGIATALAERDASKSRYGDNSHGSRTVGRRQVPTQRECTYINFLKCQPMNFKGTEGVVGLTQWVEKIESVFLISNCAITSQ